MKRALDLFCGAGGATRGLQLAGFEVTGVDIKHQPRYCGETFVQMDALAYLRDMYLGRFDLIWGSPPCQRWTSLKHAPGAKEHVDLINETRQLLRTSGRPYVIENVPRAPLVNPIELCGTMFRLSAPDGAELRRHRRFETSWSICLVPEHQHAEHTARAVLGVYGGHCRDRRREPGKNHRSGSNRPPDFAKAAMGIDWMTLTEMSQAIPPAYAKWVAEQFLAIHQ